MDNSVDRHPAFETDPHPAKRGPGLAGDGSTEKKMPRLEQRGGHRNPGRDMDGLAVNREFRQAGNPRAGNSLVEAVGRARSTEV